MKQAAVIVSVVFAIGLAVLIGTRMSADALGVLVGAVCGVLASLPTSLVLIWALVRRTQGPGVEVGARQSVGAQSYPPVVVVNPGPGYGVSGYGLPPSQSLPAAGGPRSFKVVGDEETLLADYGGVVPEDMEVMRGDPEHTEGGYYLVSNVSEITGNDLRNARRTMDEWNKPAVSFTLHPDPGRRPP